MVNLVLFPWKILQCVRKRKRIPPKQNYYWNTLFANLSLPSYDCSISIIKAGVGVWSCNISEWMFSTELVSSFFITCTYVECLKHYHMQELSFSANCETLLCSLLSILIASYVVDAYFVAHFVNPIGCNLALCGVYCVWIKISFSGIHILALWA
jgi:hypothetical protein